MKNNQANSHINIEEHSIDIIAILKKIWFERKLIIKAVILFFFIGLVVALFSPVLYTSETTFVPQVSDDEPTAKNNLGSLASIAGIKLIPNIETTDSYLSPLLYTKIIDSEEFSLNLLSAELVNSNADKFNIKEYLLSKKSFLNISPIGFFKKYTIGLFLKNDENEINEEVLKNYNFINKEDYDLIHLFRSKFSIELNEKEGYIKVMATDEDPFISTQIVEKITKSLQSKIIEIRTNKIKERLEFSKEQYELKQDEFDILQKKLAEFKDSNKNISTASFMSKLQKLESEYQLQQNILFNLASEYNNNKIKLNKDTPIFSVIDEVSVPIVRSKPNRELLVFLFVFIGLVISSGYIIARERVINLIKEIKD